MRKTAIAAVAAMMALAAGGAEAPAGEVRTLVIGSGEVTGFHYPAAGAVCRVLNKERPKGAACAVAPSSGSAANVQALRAGETDLALLQSRAAMLAFAGREPFQEAGAFPELRALMSLHGEPVVVLARPGSGIEQMADVKGKRVNMGRPGSFQRSMAEAALESAGVSEGELSPVVELDYHEQAGELCEGNIDVAFFTGVHPLPEVEEAIDSCGAVLVPLKSKTVDAYFKKAGWMSRLTVAKGTYEGQKDDLPSLGLRALLVTTTRMPSDEAYDLLKALHANFAAFSRLHPVLKGLTKAETAKDGVSVRLHDGAEKFYMETGLLK